MLEKKLALHESMEFHEVINFMTTSLLKSKLSQGVVFDDDLRALLDKNVKLSTPALAAMVKLYSKTVFHKIDLLIYQFRFRSDQFNWNA